MNTIPSESDSNAILDRLLSGAGLHRDAQLAALLGVSPQAVSQARRKRKIPEGWVVKVSQQCGLSMDWLMFGKGDESTPVASHAPVASSTSQASTPAGAAEAFWEAMPFAPTGAQRRTPLSAALTEEQYAALDRLRRQK